MKSEKSKWKTVRNHVEARDFAAAVETVSTSTDGDSVILGARPKGWGRLREEYVGRQKVIVNDIGGFDGPNEGIEKNGGNASLKSFFNVVREASAVEKKKKERPTLLKFLEKFDSVDFPESVTPGLEPGFSHFECDQGINDDT